MTDKLQVVPIEPTDAMTYIGQEMRYDSVNSIGAIYRAMLGAAPVMVVDDTARLDFMSERGYWVAWSKDGERCRVFERTDDGDTRPVCGWGVGVNWPTAREAIDAAMRVKK